MSDGQERTEQATDKRLREVRQKGQLSKSQDVTAWLAVGLGALMIPVTISRGADASMGQLFVLRSIAADPDPGLAVSALGEGLTSVGWTLLPLVAAVVAGVVAGAVLQGGVHVKRFAPSFHNFNLVKGVGRMFGKEALWGGVKALLKTSVVAAVLWTVVQDLVPVLLTAGGLPVSGLIDAAGNGAAALLRFAVIAGLVLAAADVMVIMRKNRTKTRMTKREIKDEAKTSEGDPLLRSQRRSRQLAMSRNRMMAAIADADVVLLNPTHVAVALRYEPGRAAPRVVAKGKGTSRRASVRRRRTSACRWSATSRSPARSTRAASWGRRSRRSSTPRSPVCSLSSWPSRPGRGGRRPHRAAPAHRSTGPHRPATPGPTQGVLP